MGPESEIAADKLTRFNEVIRWVHDYVKDGKFAAGTGKFNQISTERFIYAARPCLYTVIFLVYSTVSLE